LQRREGNTASKLSGSIGINVLPSETLAKFTYISIENFPCQET
jgi:hypothetical protein